MGQGHGISQSSNVVARARAIVFGGNVFFKDNAVVAQPRVSVYGKNMLSVAAGGILPLVQLLQSGNWVVKLLATAALWLLSSKPVNYAEVAAAGAVESLVKMVHLSKGFTKKDAAAVLLDLSSSGEGKLSIVAAGGIPVLVELAGDHDVSVKEMATGALWNVSTSSNTVVASAAAEALPVLVELLRDSNATLKELAAGALWNLSMSLDNKASIAGWGAITPLLELVKCGNAAHKEKAAGVLWNLAFENEDNQDRIVAACGVEPLISLALEGSRIQRQNAVGTLGCLSRHLSYDMKFCIASNGGIKSLLTFVKGSTTNKMVHTGLVALWGLCAQSGDDVRIHTQIADGEAILTSLFHTGNSNIKYLAARMLVWLTDSVAELAELCCAMCEAESMCRHVLERLQTLLTQHATSASVEAILNQFLAFLTMNENNSMVVRLASVYAVANTLAGFHRAMDQLDVRGQGELWRPQWELDRAAMKTQLFGCEVTQLVNDLNHPKEQRKALTLLVHETEHNTDSYTPIELGIFRELIKTIAKFSKLEMLPTRKWFIAPYDVQVNGDVLSRGAFGTIYLGKFKNADVVIKYIEIDSDLVRSNFLREVEVWQEASRHPNIVPFFGACHVGNPCFMMCKYISGGSIPRYLSGCRKKGIARVWRTLLGVTHGLQHLHSHGIVHSDLKGDNILMDGDVAMISDFGMSFFNSEEPPKYDNLGAIRWRAPEFVLHGEVSFASDVYSLGMCVVEALTGKLPWGDIPDVAVKWHLKNRKFISRPQQLSDVEWALVCGMCHWNSSERLSLDEVERKIKQLAEQEKEAECETRVRKVNLQLRNVLIQCAILFVAFVLEVIEDWDEEVCR